MIMSHGQYLSLLALCLIVTLPLEFVFGARVYRQPLRLLTALVPVVVVFSAWDILGIARDHWRYNRLYVTGVDVIARMPIEELAFFVVIPVCGLLTYGGVGAVLALIRHRSCRHQRVDHA
jgi:lycopene cyclase domain-containing protein